MAMFSDEIVLRTCAFQHQVLPSALLHALAPSAQNGLFSRQTEQSSNKCRVVSCSWSWNDMPSAGPGSTPNAGSSDHGVSRPKENN